MSYMACVATILDALFLTCLNISFSNFCKYLHVHPRLNELNMIVLVKVKK